MSWTAPSTRFDGTPLSLSQIAGYRVYSGTTSNSLSLVRDLNDGSATSYTVTSLAAATTYYFAVSVYDTNGNESSYSAIASKKIP
ncbi:MAG: fibronectin type III domain-containing protein [Chromatiales bacterium]|nr:fibronectin type III domain-containing protein [Chromatiales bacterium]